MHDVTQPVVAGAVLTGWSARAGGLSACLSGQDPATKFIARRFDKRESLKDDEMPLGLNTARTLEYPLLYMSARLTWTLENLTNEVTHHKQVKKDLNAKVDADAK